MSRTRRYVPPPVEPDAIDEKWAPAPRRWLDLVDDRTRRIAATVDGPAGLWGLLEARSVPEGIYRLLDDRGRHVAMVVVGGVDRVARIQFPPPDCRSTRGRDFPP